MIKNFINKFVLRYSLKDEANGRHQISGLVGMLKISPRPCERREGVLEDIQLSSSIGVWNCKSLAVPFNRSNMFSPILAPSPFPLLDFNHKVQVIQGKGQVVGGKARIDENVLLTDFEKKICILGLIKY